MKLQDDMQVAGLQITVDQEAIAKALPLRPGTRMALPLLLHAPQVTLASRYSKTTVFKQLHFG